MARRRTSTRILAAARAVAIHVLPVVVVLWLGDRWLSDDRQAGWERNAVRGGWQRTAESDANGVILLGSSTSADWLSRKSLASLFRVPTQRVTDGHINGCHQGCTFAQVRELLAEGRHYDVALFGTNLFQLCEWPHSKRVLQQRMMLPAADVPRMASLYTHAEQPLTYMMRFIGGAVSGAYADTSTIQRDASRAAFGKPRRGREHLWFRPGKPKPRAPPQLCPYEPNDIAYKRAVSAALYDDLGRLADEVYLLVLPDVTLGRTDEQARRAWQRHLALHRELADARPHVTVLDLSAEGPTDPAQYTDGFHLRGNERLKQRRRLFEMIRERQKQAALDDGGAP